MAIPKHFTMFSGKENLIASFNNWLMDTINGGYLGVGVLPVDKEFFWAFDGPILPQHTPAITVIERGLFNLGETALDKLLGFDNSGKPIYGNLNQTLIEITCIDQDTDTYTRATKVVRNLRDRVIQSFGTNSIPLKDFNNPLKPEIGSIWVDAESNSINEKFVQDPANQQVKRYIILIRIFWVETLQISTIKTISSSTIIT